MQIVCALGAILGSDNDLASLTQWARNVLYRLLRLKCCIQHQWSNGIAIWHGDSIVCRIRVIGDEHNIVVEHNMVKRQVARFDYREVDGVIRSSGAIR